MHIPLREGDDNPCLPEQIVYAKPDGAFNHKAFHQAADADPEIDLFRSNNWHLLACPIQEKGYGVIGVGVETVKVCCLTLCFSSLSS